MSQTAAKRQEDTRGEFLRGVWRRVAIAPWLLSILVLGALTSVRFYGVYGPPQFRFLFMAQVLAMWFVPLIFLTRQGRHAIGLVRPPHLILVLVGCALIGVLTGLASFGLALFFPGPPAENWIVTVRDSLLRDPLMGKLHPAVIVSILVVPAMILTPVGEEMLFRGFIHQSIAARWNAAVAIIVSCGAFGLVHIHVHGLWWDAMGFHLRLVSGGLVVLGTAITGVVFALCRIRFGSLYAAMAAHAGCNLAVLSAVIFVPFHG